MSKEAKLKRIKVRQLQIPHPKIQRSAKHQTSAMRPGAPEAFGAWKSENLTLVLVQE
jgi:hypothetical protein